MLTFYEWLAHLTEARSSLVPPEILAGYDAEIRRQLESLANTQIADPNDRSRFLAFLDCPLHDSRGNCKTFSDHVLASLIKAGVHTRTDLDAAVQYIFEKMLLPRSETGEPRTTIFSNFDPSKPDADEHFRARVLSWVKMAVNNVRKGRIKRVMSVAQQAPGTLRIGTGRQKEGEPGGLVSPEHIPGRASLDEPFTELVNDITSMLKAREPAYDLPLSDLFTAIVSGQNTEQQRAKFGDRATKMGRSIIVRIIGDYAQSTGNYQLQRLLDRFRDFQANRPDQPRRQVPAPAKPLMDPTQKDFHSLMTVFDRYQDQPLGSAVLQSARRRWAEYPPREVGTGQNRLDATLKKMLDAGLLVQVGGQHGGVRYAKGPNYDQYRQTSNT